MSMSTLEVVFTETYNQLSFAVLRECVPRDWGASSLTSASADTLAGAKILMSGAMGVSAATLEKLPALMVVQHLGVGVEKIDLAACRSRNVSVLRLCGTNSVAVAEHTVMLILNGLRRFTLQDLAVRKGQWDREIFRPIAHSLQRKRIGLLGFGAIAQAVAQRLQAFDVELLYCSRSEAEPVTAQRLGVRRVDLAELASTCDVISVHCGLNTETRGLISEAIISLMKPKVLLVNTARGEIIDQSALEAALRARPTMCAALDTLDKEPPGIIPLFTCQNAIFTPHSAGSTIDCFTEVITNACANVHAFLDDKPIDLKNLVMDVRK